jgi:hypothetical protein
VRLAPGIRCTADQCGALHARSVAVAHSRAHLGNFTSRICIPNAFGLQILVTTTPGFGGCYWLDGRRDAVVIISVFELHLNKLTHRLQLMFRTAPAKTGTVLFSIALTVLFTVILIHTEIPELLRLADNTSNDAVCVSVSKVPNAAPQLSTERIAIVFAPMPGPASPIIFRPPTQTRILFGADLLTLCSVRRT